MSWLSTVLSSPGQTIAGEIGVGDSPEALETMVDDTTSADGVWPAVTVAVMVAAVIVAFTV